MGSQNPVFVLPEAIASRRNEIAAGLAESATLGVGQFCTKPGVVAGIDIADLASEVSILMAQRQPGTMLTPQHGEAFASAVGALERIPGVDLLAGGADPGVATCMLTDTAAFAAESELRNEVFGPMTLLVSCTDPGELLQVAASFEGQLAGTIHAEPADAPLTNELAAVLSQRVGRIIYNGYPTGVRRPFNATWRPLSRHHRQPVDIGRVCSDPAFRQANLFSKCTSRPATARAEE